jgi:hypothetical protein
MERLIVLTIIRILNPYCNTVRETESGVIVSHLYESNGKRKLKTFCADNGIECEYIGGDNYRVAI